MLAATPKFAGPSSIGTSACRSAPRSGLTWRPTAAVSMSLPPASSWLSARNPLLKSLRLSDRSRQDQGCCLYILATTYCIESHCRTHFFIIHAAFFVRAGATRLARLWWHFGEYPLFPARADQPWKRQKTATRLELRFRGTRWLADQPHHCRRSFVRHHPHAKNLCLERG